MAFEREPLRNTHYALRDTQHNEGVNKCEYLF
jgi:hypothetical protein